MTDSIGDAAQIRAIAEQVGKTAAGIAISEFVAAHPEVRRGTVTAEIPAPLRWAAAVAAGLFTAGTATLAFWLVSTVSDMQVTMARVDERLANQVTTQTTQYTDLQRRVTVIENQLHRGGAR